MARAWPISLTVVSLALVAVAVGGCPKQPVLAPGAAGPEERPTAVAPPAGAPPVSEARPGPVPGEGVAAPPGPAPAAGGPAAAPGTGLAIPAVPSPKEFAETAALRNIYFDFDKYDIRSPDARILEDNATWLKANPGALVLIEGHCDERGTNEYNLALGERRAKAARDYLVSLGVAALRITMISYGEERPVCTERTEACWTENRRAHFLVKLTR